MHHGEGVQHDSYAYEKFPEDARKSKVFVRHWFSDDAHKYTAFEILVGENFVPEASELFLTKG